MQTMEIYPHKCIVVINLPWLGTLEHMERREGPRSKAENVAQRNEPGYALLEDDPARVRVKLRRQDLAFSLSFAALLI